MLYLIVYLFDRYGMVLGAFKLATAGVVSVLAPSKQGLAMLGGVYVGQQVYDGLNKSELVNKAVKVLDQELNGYLDSYLVPTQPNTDTPKQ